MSSQDDDADGSGQPPEPAESSSQAAHLAGLVSAVRAEAVLMAAAQARRLRHIAAFVTATQARLRAQADSWPSAVPFDERATSRPKPRPRSPWPWGSPPGTPGTWWPGPTS